MKFHEHFICVLSFGFMVKYKKLMPTCWDDRNEYCIDGNASEYADLTCGTLVRYRRTTPRV